MGTLLYDLPAIQRQNLVRVPHGFQSVGNHNNRLVLHQSFHGLLQLILVLRVYVCSRLIEDDNRRILENGPGNGNPLLFAPGQSGPAFADYSIVSRGKGTDKLITAGFFCRFYYFLMGGFRPAKLDVVLDGVGKELYLLENHTYLVHQRFQGVVLHIGAANVYGAMIYIPESGNQAAQSRLAGAAWADNRRCCLIGNRNGNIL